MDKRSSKSPKSPSARPHRILDKATGQPPSDLRQAESVPEPTAEERRAAAITLGRLGGKKGGKARAAKLTPEQRREIARKAANVRWHGTEHP